MIANHSRDVEALRERLAETPGDDAPRLVYVDALEETGDAVRAAAHRAIARLSLGCYPRRPDGSYLSDEERAGRESDLRDEWEIRSDDSDRVYVHELLDPKALVPVVTLGCDYGDDVEIVACAARDNLLLSELLAQVGFPS
jgi:uncharacterized protein (TIGR02996 family)